MRQAEASGTGYGEAAAEEIAADIAEWGTSVRIAADRTDGVVVTIPAHIEENPDTIRREIGAERFDQVQGRPILLSVTPGDEKKLIAGTLVYVGKEAFTIRWHKHDRLGDAVLCVVILATSGGVA